MKEMADWYIKFHQKSSNQVGNGKRQGQKRFPAGKG
jgi:hypothetical protein